MALNYRKMSSHSTSSSSSLTSWCFDPVKDLPGVLTALCLSFLDIHSLLVNAQLVSHAWRDAIDGGLPALWQDVRITDDRCSEWNEKTLLAAIAKKSRDQTMMLHAQLTTENGLATISLFSSLRVLRIYMIRRIFYFPWHSFRDILTSVPLLEDLYACGVGSIFFPTLRLIKTVQCTHCDMIIGISNLPALTKLELVKTPLVFNQNEAFPAGLRSVTILQNLTPDERILDRIASLQHPVKLHTDWSFLDRRSFFNRTSSSENPHNELAFLSNFTTLQYLTVDIGFGKYITPNYINNRIIPHQCIFNHLGAMAVSLRKLCIQDGSCTDESIQCLAQLTSLQHLSLIRIFQLTTQGLIHLSALPMLTCLLIEDCTKINNYSPIGDCRMLRKLRIRYYTQPSRHHRLLPAEIEPLARLQHLQTLELLCFVSNLCFSHICTVHSLRELIIRNEEFVIAEYIGALSPLSSLQILQMPRIKEEDLSILVDSLVQIPGLRKIVSNSQGARLSEEQKMRLREALPRLEVLDM